MYVRDGSAQGLERILFVRRSACRGLLVCTRGGGGEWSVIGMCESELVCVEVEGDMAGDALILSGKPMTRHLNNPLTHHTQQGGF